MGLANLWATLGGGASKSSEKLLCKALRISIQTLACLNIWYDNDF